MNTQNPPPSPEPDYLTVAQGRLILDQTKRVSEELEKLKPLLALLDDGPRDADQDPIARLIELLETTSNAQTRQDETLRQISQKLDWLMENRSVGEA